MKTAGIIAEYNPFHRGHQYHLEYTREKTGADYVIVAMSGDFVQRGTPALLPKYVRAEMALRCGADLVLELPVSVSTASAEYFAKGGVELLDALGVVDSLCFGSEAGEVGPLQELAKVLNKEPAAYGQFLKENLRLGLSYPVSRSKALVSYFEERRLKEKGSFSQICSGLPSSEEIAHVLSSPNNILGLEYCRAIQALNSSIRPFTLKRKGGGYHQTAITDGQFASASAIRRLLKEHAGASEACMAQIPPAAAGLFEHELKKKAYIMEEDLDALLHYCLLMEDYESLCGYHDITENLARRILNQQNEFQGFLQFAGVLKTKDLTQTRIQRALLHILLHIREVPRQMPYARILGFQKNSAPLLSEIKKHSRIPLLTKLADAPSLLDVSGRKLLEETTFASNVYQGLLSHKTGSPFIHEYEQRIILI